MRHRAFKFLSLVLSLSVGISGSAVWAWEQTDVTSAQGLIWNLNESGQAAAAKSFEKHVANILESGAIHSSYGINRNFGGISFSAEAVFENNIHGFMKLADPLYPESHKMEVAAYRLDKLLSLNFVPLTVLRTIQGETYSVQLFYPMSDLSKGDGLALPDNETRKFDLMVFDYLIANPDRSLIQYFRPSGEAAVFHNFVIGKDGRLVAIDHARAFQTELANEWAFPADIAKASQDFREKIMRAKPADIRKALRGLVLESEINLLLERLRDLQVRFASLPEGPRLTRAQEKVPVPKVLSEIQGSHRSIPMMFYCYQVFAF